MVEVFVTAYGERKAVISKLKETTGGIPEEIETLSELLDGSEYGDRIRFDFSVVNNMSYYNGFVFRGFVSGIPGGVLAGGQYDKMMARMGRRSGAVGFAIYLDMLEELVRNEPDHDVDVLLVYDGGTDKARVAAAVSEVIASGKTVSAQKTVPEKLRYREMIDLRRDD